MRKAIIKNVLRAIVLIAVVIVLAATQDIAALVDGFSRIGFLPFAAGVLLFIAANCLVAVRWSGLLAALGIHFPIFAAIKVTFVGLFYNNMLLSNIGGDLLRGWYVTKYTDKRLEAAFSVVVDRLCGFAACLLMAAAGFVNSAKLFTDTAAEANAPASAEQFPLSAKIMIAAAILLVGASVALLLLYKSGRVEGVLENLKSHISRFITATGIYIRNPFAIVNAMIITLVGQSIAVIGIYVACSSFGVDVPLKVYFIVFPLSWVIGAVPISPGGLGVLELGIVAMLAALPQVTNEQALMLALTQRLIFFAGSLPGFAIHLTGLHLPPAKE
jgi:glycosyltransferase 2 family protein